MLLLGQFFNQLGWPEIVISLFLTLVIVGIHEWKNVYRLFYDGSKTKKKNFHSEE